MCTTKKTSDLNQNLRPRRAKKDTNTFHRTNKCLHHQRRVHTPHMADFPQKNHTFPPGAQKQKRRACTDMSTISQEQCPSTSTAASQGIERGKRDGSNREHTSFQSLASKVGVAEAGANSAGHCIQGWERQPPTPPAHPAPPLPPPSQECSVSGKGSVSSEGNLLVKAMCPWRRSIGEGGPSV